MKWIVGDQSKQSPNNHSIIYTFFFSLEHLSQPGFLVCFGLPLKSLSYEETAGSPRNDDDPVGWWWHYWLEVSMLRCVGDCCLYRGLRHCEAGKRLLNEMDSC